MVTIGIPTYNRARTLERAVRSALAQDHADLEVVVSDNASTDGTEALCRTLARQDPRLRYFRQERNRGPTENFRRALELAAGEYFMWLADDDWIDPGYVRGCLALHARHPGTVLAAGAAVVELARGGERRTSGPESLAPSRALRVLRTLALVRENSVFYGVARRADLVRAEFKNLLAGDWLTVANLAALGAIRVERGVAIHRAAGGGSASYGRIIRTMRLPWFEAHVPIAVIARNVLRELASREDLHGSSRARRWLLAISAAAVVLVMHGLVWRAIAAARLAARALRGAR